MKFICAICAEEFTSTISEEEAEDNLTKEFPGFDKKDCDIVCEDCFKATQELLQ